MIYVVGFFVLALGLVMLWNKRRAGGYREDEHIPRNTDPMNDPETHRYGSTWY